MRWVLLIWLCLAAPAFAQTSPDAQLAQDMRRIVREQLATGASNEEVISHIRDSYGDYVLLKPPVQSNTYVLWAFPFVLVIVSFIWWLSTARRREIEPPESNLSDKDKALLSSLMEDAP